MGLSSHADNIDPSIQITTKTKQKTHALPLYWEQFFLKEASLTSTLYFFQRHRKRYQPAISTIDGQININIRDNFDDLISNNNTGNSSGYYQNDLEHSTLQSGINYETGRLNTHIWNIKLSYQLALYGSTDLAYGSDATRNVENEFSFAGDRWGQEDKHKSDSDISIGINAIKLNFFNDDLQLTIGRSAITVPGIIGVNWSNYAGTYRGIQMNYEVDNFVFYSAWADQYKAPWYRYTQKFYKVNAWDTLNTDAEISHIWGAGFKATTTNYILEMSYGESDNYLKSYYFKVGKQLNWGQNTSLNYLFYGSNSIANKDYQLYQGSAWQQGIRFSSEFNSLKYRAEFLINKAKGFGNYIPRLTRGYANSQGSSEFWWDSRSDWNHDGEKAIFLGVWNEAKTLFQCDKCQFLKNITIGISGAYGWGAKRWEEQKKDHSAAKGEEWALNYDISYNVNSGHYQGTTISLHVTDYNNRQDEKGSWYYPNMFTSENDIKFSINIPI